MVLSGITASQAQEWEFGLQGGASGYMGDLNPENPLAFNDWTAAATIKYNLNATWGIRGHFTHANTFAYDGESQAVQRRDRDLGFFGTIQEAALLVDFNFFRWLPQRGRIVYTPYLFAGVGGIAFNPKWYLPYQPGETPQQVNLRDVQTEYHETNNPHRYTKYAVTIPFGAGFKYNLRGPWSVGVELGYRLALTDYLDDVSGNYPANPDTRPATVPSHVELSDWQYLSYRNKINVVPGSQRGDGRPYDSFMTVGITVSYTIFKGGCPEWR